MKTLLLDKNYQPVEVISWMRAMELLLSGKAEVITEYDTDIRSVSQSWRLPSILRLLKNIKKRKYIKFSRYNIFFRDKWKCQYCGKKHKSEELTFDHVIPKSRKTSDSIKTWENIVTSCIPCNRRKANRTPREASMHLIKEPIKPNWSPMLTIRLKADDPEEWRSFIYWNTELVEG